MESRTIETEEHINRYTEGDMSTGVHVTEGPPNTEVVVNGIEYCVEAQRSHLVLQEGIEGQDCLAPPKFYLTLCTSSSTICLFYLCQLWPMNFMNLLIIPTYLG